MGVKAQWIISEAGLQSLNSAGITIGWLKLWLLSAGAESVSIHFLESQGWQQSEAEWSIFFADESELIDAAQSLGMKLSRDDSSNSSSSYSMRHFILQNPYRVCWGCCFNDHKILFIPQGDIAYQRLCYLKQLSGKNRLLPMTLFTGENGHYCLEPNLSASLQCEGVEQVADGLLNREGSLLEELVIDSLRQEGLKLRTVESCTAGAISTRIARVPGASDVLDRSWITYSNCAKSEEVAVSETLIENCGAVSPEVVSAMADGAAGELYASIAVSGIAGPGGGSPEKPVGTVWIGVSVGGGKVKTQHLQLSGSRHVIQWAVVNSTLMLLLRELNRR